MKSGVFPCKSPGCCPSIHGCGAQSCHQHCPGRSSGDLVETETGESHVHMFIFLSINLPVVPARGGAEVALKIYTTPFSSIELACAVRQPSPCVRALCETDVVFHMSHLKLHFTVDSLHTPHYTLHTALFALHTPHSSHSTLFTLHTAPFAVNTSHFTLHTSHFTLHTSHCTLHAPHFTLHSSHSTLHLI